MKPVFMLLALMVVLLCLTSGCEPITDPEPMSPADPMTFVGFIAEIVDITDLGDHGQWTMEIGVDIAPSADSLLLQRYRIDAVPTEIFVEDTVFAGSSTHNHWSPIRGSYTTTSEWLSINGTHYSYDRVR